MKTASSAGDQLPLVAVSACLLGHAVRYDGKDKHTDLIANKLALHCNLIAVCPEIEIGLGVPRPKIQLTQIEHNVRVLRVGQPEIDLTDLLVEFAIQFSKQQPLAGLVLQDKSPSCGLGNTKVFSGQGQLVGFDSGLFASTMVKLNPKLKTIRASQLKNNSDIANFVKAINQ